MFKSSQWMNPAAKSDVTETNRDAIRADRESEFSHSRMTGMRFFLWTGHLACECLCVCCHACYRLSAKIFILLTNWWHFRWSLHLQRPVWGFRFVVNWVRDRFRGLAEMVSKHQRGGSWRLLLMLLNWVYMASNFVQHLWYQPFKL